MFKERLKIVGRKICYGLIPLGFSLLIIGICVVASILTVKYPVIDTIIQYSIYSVIGICALIILLMVILKVYLFINWLFVEPFKTKKKINS